MLRGWLEIGMSNPNMFQYQSNSDIVLRTYDTTQTNKIIIGNTSSNDAPNRKGAMYVASNTVGIRKVPRSGYTLDVDGLFSTDNAEVSSNITTSQLKLRGLSNVSFINSNNNLLISTQGHGGVEIDNRVYAKEFALSSATFKPALCNSYMYSDATSNDIIINTSDIDQKILFGFGSNTQSTLVMSKSNMTMANGRICVSNIGVGTMSPPSGYDLYVSGPTRIEGDLTINGSMVYMNTDVQVTDQFTVSNAGTGPALIVSQTGTQPIAEFRDDDDVVMKIYDGGFITIGSNVAQTKLDVEGNTTVRGTIFTSNVVTSNISTSSITSTQMSTSNLIINAQVVIGSDGIVSNSNFLPNLDTTKIVSGTFSSNFIEDGHIISSKLESNIALHGTPTVSNGEMLVLGESNFEHIGDQARYYMGQTDYFIGSSRGVGIVMQVPGTVYPFVIENTTGNVGIGSMDPEESLHIEANAKVVGSHYVMDKLGVGTSNPDKAVTVNGDIRASSNIQGSVGTLGPCFSLISHSAYADVFTGDRLVLNHTLEAGNPGSSLFYGNTFLYQDASDENMSWNAARLLFRGCPLTPDPSVSTFNVQEGLFDSNINDYIYTNITTDFTLSNEGSASGYVTYGTPWFSMTNSNARQIALFLSSNDQNSSFRVGQVVIQFKT